MPHKCPPPRKGCYSWPCRVCNPRYYEPRKDVQWFVLHVVGDIEPELKGPFLTEFGMEKAARRLKEEVGDEDGIYWLVRNGFRLDTGSWSGGFFMKGPDAEED